MDPPSIEGEPYGPYRFKEIIKEQYLISKSINTSFNDLEQITPRERELLIEFILDDNKKVNQMIEDAKKKAKK